MTVFVAVEMGTILSVDETVFTDIEVVVVLDIPVDADSVALLKVTASVEVDFAVVGVFAESFIEAVIDGLLDVGREFFVIDVVGDDIVTDAEMMPGFSTVVIALVEIARFDIVSGRDVLMEGIVCIVNFTVVGSVAFGHDSVEVSEESTIDFVVNSGTTDVSLASLKGNVPIVCVVDSC